MKLHYLINPSIAWIVWSGGGGSSSSSALAEAAANTCENGTPVLTAPPDVSYTPGNLRTTYDSSTATSNLTLTFAYSGMGDGSGDDGDSNSDVISFEAALYAYSYEQERCLFDTAFSVTEGAKLATDPPPATMPYPITIQPVDTSTLSPKNPVVTLQVLATAKLEAPLFEPNIPCNGNSDIATCRRIGFCVQLQVLVCRSNLIDFVDVQVGTEFDIIADDNSCGDSGCLKVREKLGKEVGAEDPTADGGDVGNAAATNSTAEDNGGAVTLDTAAATLTITMARGLFSYCLAISIVLHLFLLI